MITNLKSQLTAVLRQIARHPSCCLFRLEISVALVWSLSPLNISKEGHVVQGFHRGVDSWVTNDECCSQGLTQQKQQWLDHATNLCSHEDKPMMHHTPTGSGCDQMIRQIGRHIQVIWKRCVCQKAPFLHSVKTALLKNCTL